MRQVKLLFSDYSFQAEQKDMQQGYIWFINKTISTLPVCLDPNLTLDLIYLENYPDTFLSNIIFLIPLFMLKKNDMQQGYVLSVNNGLCSASRFHQPHLFYLWPYLSRKLYVRIKLNYYFSYSSFQAEQNDMEQG